VAGRGLIGAVVQARMYSQRLPGKVLMELGDRPALAQLLDRLERARELDGIVVATSNEPDDDAVAAFCAERGTRCHRGPLDDVARRMADAAGDWEAFVRVNGDSPLLDPALVDHGVRLYRASGDVDLVSNVWPRRSFPRGQSVEVVRTAVLRAALDELDADGREHVTLRLYDRSGVRVLGFAAEHDASDRSLALDTPQDAERLRELVGIEGGWEALL
jgi:spore coat polysaccharide biosynthesis protein SpsF (cytidylyltransferase family)